MVCPADHVEVLSEQRTPKTALDKTPKQDNVVKDGFQYLNGQVVNQATSIIRGVILPNLLTPFHYGIIAMLSLVERYSVFTNLGVHTANLYQVPARRAVGDIEEAERIKNCIYSFSLLMGGLGVLLILFGTLSNAGRLSREMFWGLLILSVIPLLTMYRGTYMTLLRADKKFGLMGKATTFSSVLGSVLVVLLAWRFKVYGVLVGQVLALAALLLFVQRKARFKFKFMLLPKKIWELLQFSIPIFFIIGFLSTFLLTLDRLMIAKYLGIQAVGFYSIALTLSSFILLPPSAISMVLSTRIIESCSRSAEEAQRQICPALYLIALSTSFLAALLSLAVPCIFEIIFRKYKPGIPSAMILPFALYFEAIGYLPNDGVIGMGKMKPYILFLALTTGGSYLLFLFFLKGRGLVMAASLMVVSLFVKNLALLFLCAFAVLKNSKKRIFGFVAFPLLVFLVAGMGVFVLNTVFPNPVDTGIAPLLGCFFIRSFFLILVYFPLLFYVDKKTGLLKLAYQKLKEALPRGEGWKAGGPTIEL